MDRFPSPDALTQAFVKAYYTTSVYKFSELPRFYRPGARISRNGVVMEFSPPVAFAKSLSLGNPSNSTLTVLNFTMVQLDSGLSVTVTGAITSEDKRSGFSQTFVLTEADERFWVIADVATIIGDPLSRDETFEVPNGTVPGAQRAPRGDRQPDRASSDLTRPPPGKGSRTQKGSFNWSPE